MIVLDRPAVTVGAGFGLAFAAIPDSVVEPLTKLVVAVVTAFLCGFAYSLGSRLAKGKGGGDA